MSKSVITEEGREKAAYFISPAPSTQEDAPEITPEEQKALDSLEKKFGRRFVMEKETKTARVNLMLTPSTKARAKARAAARNMSLNEYISWLINHDKD